MMRKIVVTDGFTLNPGDLSWKSFDAFGDVNVFDRTAASETTSKLRDAEIIITNKTVINRKTIMSLKKLSLICVTATGYNVVDVKAASEQNIVVCNVPAYGTDSVAQHTIALILALTNHVGINSRLVAEGAWSRSVDWCFTKAPLIELAGKTIGVIGYGRIGKRVAEIASVFGMDVIFSNPSIKKGIGRQVEIEELFEQSDVITLHCPLTSSNAGFVNESLLSRMKPTSFLINTSRGPLIHEPDLAQALKLNRIAGAAVDVLSSEPPPADHPLIGLQNCIVTPHNAWLSFEARKRILDTTFENIRCALEGRPQNVVNKL